METFHDAGYDVRLVGGAVRDILHGVPPRDWDLAVSADPEAVMRLFRRVVPVGIRHGTVQILTDTEAIEATFIGPPEQGGFLADLRRRDFTMNAMEVSWPDGELLDPFSGQRDLETGIIRGVDDPRLRLREDPLRILRAARFVGELGFTIHRDTLTAMREEVNGLQEVAAERIREELFKLLVSPHALEALEILIQCEAMRIIFPEVNRHERKTPEEPRIPVCRFGLLAVYYSLPRIDVRLGALLGGMEISGSCGSDPAKQRAEALRFAASAMNRLKTSAAQTARVLTIMEHRLPDNAAAWSDARLRAFMAVAGVESLEDIFDLAVAERMAHAETTGQEANCSDLLALRIRAEELLRASPPLRVKDLAVDGQDVMAVLNAKPGPRVGQILSALLDETIQEPNRNKREALLEIVRRKYGRDEEEY